MLIKCRTLAIFNRNLALFTKDLTVFNRNLTVVNKKLNLFKRIISLSRFRQSSKAYTYVKYHNAGPGVVGFMAIVTVVTMTSVSIQMKERHPPSIIFFHGDSLPNEKLTTWILCDDKLHLNLNVY